MITFHQVSKRYSNHHEALLNVSFSMKPGEMAFLTGHSGAGKSTLIKLIYLIEKPSTGTITVNQKNTSRLCNRQIPFFRRNIGLIFQDPLLLYDHTVHENVAMPLIIAGFKYSEIAKRVRATLHKVNLQHKEKSFPEMLSSGEQQRVGIARAIINKPPIILADEPTGNLDSSLAKEIMNLFVEFNQAGVTVLIASHDNKLINKFKYRVLTLDDGILIGDSTNCQTSGSGGGNDV